MGHGGSKKSGGSGTTSSSTTYSSSSTCSSSSGSSSPYTYSNSSTSTTTTSTSTSTSATAAPAPTKTHRDSLNKVAGFPPAPTTPAPTPKKKIDGFDPEDLEAMFKQFETPPGEGKIGPDGIEQLCTELGVVPEDISVLVLAWHLNAQEMGFFSREEFIGGLEKLKIDNIVKFRAQMTVFRDELNDFTKFREVYRFAFFFAKEKESKILDIGAVDPMLKLLTEGRYPFTPTFREFLQDTGKKSMNLDQWTNFLDFSRSVKKDFAGYDETSAWPVLLDEYVEWAKEKGVSIV
ncbi:DCN1-like protein 4/5 [Pelomyxa schiedti]|nr:DCN1-like protein 4/5 [Pelomyxa schiedti]